MNKQFKTNNGKRIKKGIEWTDYTWNPIAGCKHGCQWTMPDGKVAICYADTVASGVAQKAYPEGFDHHYWKPDLLGKPLNVKTPSKIFVGSMADVFGHWVPDEQIEAVLDVCRQAHWHTFQFLTKNAKRLTNFSYPPNVWLGVSVPPSEMFGKPLTLDQQKRWYTVALNCLCKTDARIKWTSIEPLSWDCSGVLEKFRREIHWAVIGAATRRRKAYQPDSGVFSAVLDTLHLNGVPIFYKGNISQELAHNLSGQWLEQFPETPSGSVSMTLHLPPSCKSGIMQNWNGTWHKICDDDIHERMCKRYVAWCNRQKETETPDMIALDVTDALKAARTTNMKQWQNTVVPMEVSTYLDQLPDESIHAVVTSPPYFRLRDYGVDGQLGLEDTLEEYIERLVMIFRSVRRVLRPDGTVWLNLGDSYARKGGDRGTHEVNGGLGNGRHSAHMPSGKHVPPTGLKAKDLMGVPWRVAFALQADGWYLRQACPWQKRNPVPESVKDRPTTAHEYWFLLTKSKRYWYDYDGVRQPGSGTGKGDNASFRGGGAYTGNQAFDNHTTAKNTTTGNKKGSDSRNLWSTDFYFKWIDEQIAYLQSLKNDIAFDENGEIIALNLATESYPDAHFATFGEKMIRIPVSASCPPYACESCSIPYDRVVEVADIALDATVDYDSKYYELGKEGKAEFMATRLSQHRKAGGRHDNPFPARITKGWEAQCECEADTVPGVVLDPFMGSGTVGVVAKFLDRNFMGCDLNPDYAEMANNRIRQHDPYQAFVHEDGAVQLSLFETLDTEATHEAEHAL